MSFYTKTPEELFSSFHSRCNAARELDQTHRERAKRFLEIAVEINQRNVMLVKTDEEMKLMKITCNSTELERVIAKDDPVSVKGISHFIDNDSHDLLNHIYFMPKFRGMLYVAPRVKNRWIDEYLRANKACKWWYPYDDDDDDDDDDQL